MPERIGNRGDAPGGTLSRGTVLAVLVAALGYFVDLFDLVLFSILRIPSLKALGITDPDQLTAVGKRLLDIQLVGMLLGGVAFGMLGDRMGRLKTLFGSILLYSVANILNAFVTDVWQYEVLRFVAGFGLAGELGAGITLVAELLPTAKRGIGTTIVATVGLSGAVAAGVAGSYLQWNHCYLIGGCMGLALLALRVGVSESGLFRSTKERSHAVHRGNPLQLLWPPRRFARFAMVVLSGMPIWFVGGVMFVFAPELGKAMGIEQPIEPAKVIFWAYLGVVVGDVASGLVSQLVRSRTRTIMGFLAGLAACIVLFFAVAPKGPSHFYGMMCLVGAATGYWAIFVTTASEQFGTNLRATAATSAPNFVRAMAVPITSIWLAAKPGLGTVPATVTIGICCVAVGLLAALALDETFHRDLDYLEH
ncbi:MAG: MFS transporter [Planctomycetes bacterium]|nr:MFS transporter [Planctomycetota bacterium]